MWPVAGPRVGRDERSEAHLREHLRRRRLVRARRRHSHLALDPVDPEGPDRALRTAIRANEVPGTEAKDQAVAFDLAGSAPVGKAHERVIAQRALQHAERRERGQQRHGPNVDALGRREFRGREGSRSPLEAHGRQREGQRLALVRLQVELG